MPPRSHLFILRSPIDFAVLAVKNVVTLGARPLAIAEKSAYITSTPCNSELALWKPLPNRIAI